MLSNTDANIKAFNQSIWDNDDTHFMSFEIGTEGEEILIFVMIHKWINLMHF